MFRHLWPQETSFFDYFEAQAQLIEEVAKLLMQIALDGTLLNEKILHIQQLEQKADDIVHTTIESLHKTFITPFDREDMHKLITLLDDIIDEIDAVADCLMIYRIERLTPFARECAEHFVLCSQELFLLVCCLREPPDIESCLKHCHRISLAKSGVNQIRRNALGQLFDQETDARTIIKWKEIYEHLEKSIDLCDDAANVIEGILLEYC